MSFGWRKNRRAVVCQGMLLIGCVLFFHNGVYVLANTSLRGWGPFPKLFGVHYLAYRGQQRDYERLLAALGQADWDAPFEYRPRSIGAAKDWRATAVDRLMRHDRQWAAEHLAALLLERPSQQLIDMTGGLFVETRRYETAPIFMRYALLDSLFVTFVTLINITFTKLVSQRCQPH